MSVLDLRFRKRLAIGLWAIVAVLLVLIFRPELGRLFGSSSFEEVPATSSEPVAATTSAPAAPSSAPPPPPAPAAPATVAASASVAVEPSARPTTVDGKDADTWRNMLRGAVARSDAAIAAQSLAALATIDPERLADAKVFADAVSAANLGAAANQDLEKQVFDVLGGAALGHWGPDVLYRITSLHGGSRAAKRAAELLKDGEVLARATPALLVAMAIRDAPCNDRPPLFDRAAKEGDERALFLLQAMRAAGCGQSGCCIRNDPKLDAAIGALRERVSKGG
jgi:serine/threonine-protein kinase